MPETPGSELDETPSLNRRGSYRDDKGRIWTVVKAEAPRIGVSTTAITSNLPKDAGTLTVRNRRGLKVVAHLRADMRRGVRHLLAPKDSDDVYVAESGRHYATQRVAARELGISVGIVRSSQRPTHKIKIKTPKGPRILICIDDLRTQPAITARLNAEIKVDEYGYYNDDEGLWCTINAFWDSLLPAVKEKTNRSSLLAKAKKNCRSKIAKNRADIPGTQIFLVSELMEKTLDVANPQLRVDKRTGYCIDKDGEKWSTIDGWAKLMQVNRNAIYAGIEKVHGALDNVPHKEGFNSAGKKQLLYCETIIRKILAYILEAEILVINGVYRLMDETKQRVLKVYHSEKKLRETIPVSGARIRKKLEDINCPNITGIDRQSGRKIKAYDVETARAVFKQQIDVVLETDDEGEVENDPQYGRLLTLSKYLARYPEVSRRELERAIGRSTTPCIRRRDTISRKIVRLYPVVNLDRIIANGN